MDRLTRIPVQVFPVLPFVGPADEGALINLSAGGMALLLAPGAGRASLAKGARIRVHFRLPGLPLVQCKGIVTHAGEERDGGWMRLGVRFVKFPTLLADRIERMILDDDACEHRLQEPGMGRCDTACAFHSLCSKPIRQAAGGVSSAQFEIALQRAAH